MENAQRFEENIKNLRSFTHKYFSVESREAGLNFKPSQTDVILSSGRKCGTTWVAQICHSLRSRGDMDFKEIAYAVPHLEISLDNEYGDLQKPQPYHPRLYKTHFHRSVVPKGAGKYITVIRRPTDAIVSCFYFLENWFFKAGTVALEEFVDYMISTETVRYTSDNRKGLFTFVAEWYPHRLDENVLWLHYEDLKEDLSACVRIIAEFLDIGKDDEELQKTALYQASFEFMKQNETKYDGHVLKLARNRALGLPEDLGLKGNEGKVRKGESNGSRKVLSNAIEQKLKKCWKEIVAPVCGYENYDEMRAGINKELGRKFGS